MQWAMTQNNLGGALLRLGERSTDPSNSRPRSRPSTTRSSVFIAASAIYYVEVCWENRDRAIALVAEHKGSRSRIRAAEGRPNSPRRYLAIFR